MRYIYVIKMATSINLMCWQFFFTGIDY